MTKSWLLISVCEREILTEQFDSFEAAQAQMKEELAQFGKVPQDILDNYKEFDDGYDYGFGEDCGWSNNGDHGDYDWRIIQIN